ncbi:MAG: hypothetical protein KDA42_18155 [Planctomycetales bacterium]|nr:hypothetical protein [Planctomycetales bacterium]
MSTTNLFVELLVIGVGAACWVALGLASVAGIGWIESDVLQSYPALAVMLALVYVLGIISDRVADWLFDIFFSGRIRSCYFEEKRDYQDARRLVISNSTRLADMHEYGRTRIRICRGWSLNAAMMAVCWCLFIETQAAGHPWRNEALAFGLGGFGLLSVAAWWSWQMLCAMEYLKIREHAEFLRGQGSTSQFRNAA